LREFRGCWGSNHSFEIEQLFTLETDELACAKARRTPLHQLAVALHIIFLKATGRLLNSVEIVPVSVLGLSGISCAAGG